MDYDNLKNLFNDICDYERIGDNPKIEFKNDILYISNIHIKSMKANDISLKNIVLDFDNVTFSVDLYELLEKFYEVSEERLNITKEIRFYRCDFFQDTSIEKSIFQESCIFKDCRFNNIQFECINVDFNKDFNIIRSSSDKEICFKSCKFLNQGLASGLFIEKLTMNNLNFYGCEIYDLHSCNNSFKNIKIINCSLRNEAIFSHDKYFQSLSFSHNSIEKIEFKNIDIWVKDFKNHTIRFIDNTFNASVYFGDCKFLGKANFDKSIFNDVVKFYKTYFHNNTFFRDCKFLKNTSFKRIEFQRFSYFNRTVFHSLADFSNANFMGYANFEKANFKDVVYFYKANFQSFINMSNCTINDVMSFYGAKLYYTPYLAGVNIDKNAKFNLMHIEQNVNLNIENAANEYSVIVKAVKTVKDESVEIGIDTLDIVKGFRESFRILKSYLISNHNLLEASFYRVKELKAKELEMDLMKDDLSLSESLENFLFKIYKNTSNHHSDLLRILCFTLCMAGLYIIMSCFVTYIANPKISFVASVVFFGLVCFRYMYCKKDYLPLWFWGVLLYAVFGFIVFDVLTMFCFGVFVFMVYVLVFKFNHIVIWCAGAFVGFILVMHNPHTILPLGGIISQDLKNYHLNQAILNLDETTSMKLAKTIDTTILTELKAKQTLLDNVKVLNDSVFDEYASLKNAKSKDSIMQKINFIYYLMMILCLFSLQKTARKNSIMPN